MSWKYMNKNTLAVIYMNKRSRFIFAVHEEDKF